MSLRQLRAPLIVSLIRGGFLAGRGVEAQARAHALLPGALFLVDFFDLGERGRQ